MAVYNQHKGRAMHENHTITGSAPGAGTRSNGGLHAARAVPACGKVYISAADHRARM